MPSFYILLGLVLMPWVLLTLGALVRVARGGTDRVHRLQLEGMGILLCGMIACWLVFDPNFGFDKYRLQEWSSWMERGEAGAFWIGLLFFMLGYLLERRPRPGLVSLPMAWRVLSVSFIVLGLVLAQFAWKNVNLPFVDLPWGLPRGLISLGFIPFSVGYIGFRLFRRD